MLTFLLTTFNVFELGASVVISLILCDIAKEQVRRGKGESLSTISGIVDGVAGSGSIIGQLLIGPVEAWKGWVAGFTMFAIASVLATIPPIPFTINEIVTYKRKRKLNK